MNPPTFKLFSIAACYVPVAAIAEAIPNAGGDWMRDGGLIAVLVVGVREILKYLAKRDQQLAERDRQLAEDRAAFLSAQDRLVALTREAIAAAKRTCAACGDDLPEKR